MTPGQKVLRAGELFQLYPQLAARVTSLRTIIQSPELPIPQADRIAWSEDVRSTLSDFMLLCEQTRDLLNTLPKE